MPVATAEDAVAAYQAAMASSAVKEKYRKAIDAVTVNPMEMAASEKSEALYLSSIQESVSSGRRRAALLATPISRYKENARTTGADRLQTGAKKAEAKMREVLRKWAPAWKEAADAAAAIPKDGTTATALAKVEAAMKVMKRTAGKEA